ncbi:MAG TPA: MFS transporter [Acidimicrobiia bacterium]|nr:MFS transporter [Acidimicrobiia bacterium]
MLWSRVVSFLPSPLWFSATAVAPQLADELGLDAGAISGLTLAVQLGFVVGALVLAISDLADIVPSRTLFAISAVVGAAVNAMLLTIGPGSEGWIFPIRFITGAALAGVYPAGLKVMSGWFKSGRGLGLGALVGALTVGSAGPHLIHGFGLEWKGVVGTASVLAIMAAGLLYFLVTDGPYETEPHRFDWRSIGDVIGNRGFQLSTYGYLGHMWELYAMWTWTAAFLAASAREAGVSESFVPTATFFIIAIGGVGAWLFGRWADRYGRTRLAGISLVASGTAAVLTPLVFGLSPFIVVGLFLFWGFTVVADSAQFSAMVTEVSDDATRGTALALQTAVGFLLTLVTIRGVPVVVELLGWRWAFPLLALGPVIGIEAMIRLKRSSYATSLAGGRG